MMTFRKVWLVQCFKGYLVMHMSLAAAMQMDILDPIQHNSISPI